MTQLTEQVDRLRGRVRELRRENQRLREQLNEIRSGQMDIFTVINDNERLKLKSTVNDLIERIDRRLGPTRKPDGNPPTDPGTLPHPPHDA